MEGYLTFTIDQLSVAGFFNTRASLYMDFIISYLLVLPVLSTFAIYLAFRQQIKLHQFIHSLLFFLTVVVLGAFAYGVHYQEGFETLLAKSSMEYSRACSFLWGHIIIVSTTLLAWMFVLIYAVSDRNRRALPGVYSASHARSGKRVLFGIFLTSLSSGFMYWILFIG